MDIAMKPCVPRLPVVISLGFFLVAGAAAQQSLGDAAREARKNKPSEPTTKVITNEELRSSGGLALPDYGTTPADDKDAKADSEAKVDADKDKDKDKDKPKASLSADDQAKLDKDWQDKISKQKDQIALLERELDVLQRETKLRASNYYGDAGTRLRDPQKYADDDRKSRSDIAAKQKELDDAKANLEQMRDDARKAGANGVG